MIGVPICEHVLWTVRPEDEEGANHTEDEGSFTCGGMTATVLAML